MLLACAHQNDELPAPTKVLFIFFGSGGRRRQRRQFPDDTHTHTHKMNEGLRFACRKIPNSVDELNFNFLKLKYKSCCEIENESLNFFYASDDDNEDVEDERG